MSQEIELKLALNKSAVTALRRHPVLASAEKCGNARTLVNTYFDTADLTLHARKVALRTRKQGGKLLQTVKCDAGSSGGLSSRPEWEQPFADRFDFSAIDDAALADRLRTLADDLVPVFTTRFRRETWRITPTDAVEILLVIDSGTIKAGTREAPICEVELELVRGDPASLFDLACQLAADVPLMPADRSKAERGYRLFTDTAEAPVRAVKSPLNARHTPLEAFLALADDGLHQWQANALAACEHDDPEYIHQLRIALRRLRSLFRLFAPALPAPLVARWREILRDTASGTREAHDFDVIVDDILPPATPAPLMHTGLLDDLQVLAIARRDAARKHVRERLAEPDMGWHMLSLARDLHALGVDALGASVNLTAFARQRLRKLRKRARKRFAAAREAACILRPDDLHDLRVSLKQLRYTTEFFAPLLDDKVATHYVSSLHQVQDQLAYLEDVLTARTIMLDWADATPALTGAAHFVIGWHASNCAQVRRRMLSEIEATLWGKAPWKARRSKPTGH